MNTPATLDEMNPDNLWVVFFQRDPLSLRPHDADPVGHGFELADPGAAGSSQIHKAGKGCVIATLSARSLATLEKELNEKLGQAQPGLAHFLVADTSGMRWVEAASSEDAIREATGNGHGVLLCGGLEDVTSLSHRTRTILLKKDYDAISSDRRPNQPPLVYGMSWLSRKHDPDIAAGLDEIGGW